MGKCQVKIRLLERFESREAYVLVKLSQTFHVRTVEVQLLVLLP